MELTALRGNEFPITRKILVEIEDCVWRTKESHFLLPH